MNRIFKVIWNRCVHRFSAVSEVVKSKGKAKSEHQSDPATNSALGIAIKTLETALLAVFVVSSPSARAAGRTPEDVALAAAPSVLNLSEGQTQEVHGNLTFDQVIFSGNGGVISFESDAGIAAYSDGSWKSSAAISANSVVLSVRPQTKAVIEVHVSGAADYLHNYPASQADFFRKTPLLQMDDGLALVNLIKVTTQSQVGSSPLETDSILRNLELRLKDKEGAPLDFGVHEIESILGTDASGYVGYSLVGRGASPYSSNESNLSLGVSLLALQIKEDGLTISDESTKFTGGHKFDAVLFGDGKLTVEPQATKESVPEVVLTNPLNRLSGDVVVSEGIKLRTSHHALGHQAPEVASEVAPYGIESYEDYASSYPSSLVVEKGGTWKIEHSNFISTASEQYLGCIVVKEGGNFNLDENLILTGQDDSSIWGGNSSVNEEKGFFGKGSVTQLSGTTSILGYTSFTGTWQVCANATLKTDSPNSFGVELLFKKGDPTKDIASLVIENENWNATEEFHLSARVISEGFNQGEVASVGQIVVNDLNGAKFVIGQSNSSSESRLLEDFNGTLTINNAEFDISRNHGLDNVKYVAGSGSVTNVLGEEGGQTLRAVQFTEGTINFSPVSLGQRSAIELNDGRWTSFLKVKEDFQVGATNGYKLNVALARIAPKESNILDRDELDQTWLIIKEGSLPNTAEAVELGTVPLWLSGAELSGRKAVVSEDIGGATARFELVGTADEEHRLYGALKQNDIGLFFEHQLYEVDMNVENGVLDLNAEGTTKDLNAKITGDQGTIQVRNGTVIFEEPQNDFESEVRILGRLVAADTGALGHARLVSVASGGSLDLGQSEQTIGAISLAENATLTGNGVLNLTHGQSSSASAHTEWEGAVNVGQEASLLLNHTGGFGSSVTLDNAELIFGQGANGLFTTPISGLGVVDAREGADVTLGAAIDSLSDQSVLRTQGGRMTVMPDAALGHQTIEVKAGGEFVLQRSGSGFALSNQVIGEGGLAVIELEGGELTFGEHTLSNYEGKLLIEGSHLTLTGEAASELAGTTLLVGRGSVVNLQGQQSVGGFGFDEDGVLDFGDIRLGQKATAQRNRLDIQTLELSDAGVVKIHLVEGFPESDFGESSTYPMHNLLTQDDGDPERSVVLARWQETAGTGAGPRFELTGAQGQAAYHTLLDDQGQEIAQLRYGNVAIVEDHSWSVGYSLVEAEVAEGQRLTLSDPGQGQAGDLRAVISGKGGLLVQAGADGQISLSAENTFEGQTEVASGALLLKADDALATSEKILVSTGAALAVADNTRQSFKTLAADGGSTIALGSGSSLQLMGESESTIAGQLTGGEAASFTVENGSLVVSSANESFAGAFTVAENASVQLKSAAAVGVSGDLNIEGLVTISDNDFTLGKRLSGQGTLVVAGTGEVNFAGGEFSGQLLLNGLDLTLTEVNKAVLEGAHVVVESGSTLTVPGSAKLRQLTGGRVNFSEVALGQDSGEHVSFLTVDTLDGALTVVVDKLTASAMPDALALGSADGYTQLASSQKPVQTEGLSLAVDAFEIGARVLGENGTSASGLFFIGKELVTSGPEGNGLYLTSRLVKVDLDQRLDLKGDGDFSALITGSEGSLNIEGGEVRLKQLEETYRKAGLPEHNNYTAKTEISEGAALVALDDDVLGRSALVNVQGRLDLRGTAQTIGRIEVGQKAGLSGEGSLSITSEQSRISAKTDWQGNLNVGAQASLLLEDAKGLGEASTIELSGKLIFGAFGSSDKVFGALVEGDGVVVAADGSDVTIVNRMVAALQVETGGRMSVSREATIGQGRIDVAKGGQFDLQREGDFQLTNKVGGAGLFTLNLAGGKLELGESSVSEFAGRFRVESLSLELSSQAASVLSKAALEVGEGSVVQVSGQQRVAGLSMCGGALDFGEISLGSLKATNLLRAENLDLSGLGTVRVRLAETVAFEDYLENDPKKFENLLVQDDGEGLVILAEGAQLATGGSLRFEVTGGKQYSHILKENGVDIAELIYGGVGLVQDKQLAVGYGLIEAEVKAGQKLKLFEPGQGEAAEFKATISGEGGLQIEAGEHAISLSSGNSYQGQTLVESGQLLLKEDAALGQSSKLEIRDLASVAIVGQKTQWVGALDAQGLLDLDQGSLYVGALQPSRIDGLLKGTSESQLWVGVDKDAGAELVVSGANKSFAGAVTIGAASTVTIHKEDSLGTTGTLTVDGKLKILPDAEGDVTISKRLLGSGVIEAGSIEQKPGSWLNLTAQDSDFVGTLELESLSLRLDRDGEDATQHNQTVLEDARIVLMGNKNQNDRPEIFIAASQNAEGQRVGELAIDGGLLNFEKVVLGQNASEDSSFLTTKHLSGTGQGQLLIKMAVTGDIAYASQSVLQQDNDGLVTRLIKSEERVTDLSTTDVKVHVIGEDNKEYIITNDSISVTRPLFGDGQAHSTATGRYELGATGQDASLISFERDGQYGLFLGYQLVEVDLNVESKNLIYQQTEGFHLQNLVDPTQPAASGDGVLEAHITGSRGRLVIKEGAVTTDATTGEVTTLINRVTLAQTQHQRPTEQLATYSMRRASPAKETKPWVNDFTSAVVICDYAELTAADNDVLGRSIEIGLGSQHLAQGEGRPWEERDSGDGAVLNFGQTHQAVGAIIVREDARITAESDHELTLLRGVSFINGVNLEYAGQIKLLSMQQTQEINRLLGGLPEEGRQAYGLVEDEENGQWQFSAPHTYRAQPTEPGEWSIDYALNTALVVAKEGALGQAEVWLPGSDTVLMLHNYRPEQASDEYAQFSNVIRGSAVVEGESLRNSGSIIVSGNSRVLLESDTSELQMQTWNRLEEVLKDEQAYKEAFAVRMGYHVMGESVLAFAPAAKISTDSGMFIEKGSTIVLQRISPADAGKASNYALMNSTDSGVYNFATPLWGHGRMVIDFERTSDELPELVLYQSNQGNIDERSEHYYRSVATGEFFRGSLEVRNAHMTLDYSGLENQNPQQAARTTTNVMALSNAMLVAGQGSFIEIGYRGDDSGLSRLPEQKVGGLDIDGGTVKFTRTEIGTSHAESYVNATSDVLDLSHRGKVEMVVTKWTHAPTAEQMKNAIANSSLLQQDEGYTLLKAAGAQNGQVIGNASGLQLSKLFFNDFDDSTPSLELVFEGNGELKNSSYPQDSQALFNYFAPGQEQDIQQGEQTVAKAQYGYGISAYANEPAYSEIKDMEPGQGLFLAYVLQKVDILADQTLELATAGAATAPASEFHAQITGQGGLKVDASMAEHGVITLSNARGTEGANSYQGLTTVARGTLKMGDDGVLGHSSGLVVEKAAVFASDGHAQQLQGDILLSDGARLDLGSTTNKEPGAFVAKRIQASNATIEMGTNSLVLEEGGLISGSLSSEASNGYGLVTLGGDLVLQSDGSVLKGKVFVGSAEEFKTVSGQAHLSSGTEAKILVTSSLALGEATVEIGSSGAVVFNAPELNQRTFNANSVNGIVSPFGGSGTVQIETGEWSIQAANPNFAGTWQIGQAATVMVDVAAEHYLGRSYKQIELNGQLNLSVSDSWTLSRASGAGQLHKYGAGLLQLGEGFAQTEGSDRFSGLTHIHEGVLTAGEQRGHLAGALSIDRGASAVSIGTVGGLLTNAGEFHIGSVAANSRARTTDQSFSGATSKVGSYEGKDGVLVFRAALAGDQSPTDQLHIEGNASGTGIVRVTNLGGAGAQTSEHGITLVTVDGDSSLSLRQEGRITAGAYDYVLLRDPDSRRFFLQSTPGEYSVLPEAPVGSLLRPEAGSYMAGLATAQLFEHRLHDRLGETRFVDPFTSEVRQSSAWVRTVGQHGHFRMHSGATKTHTTNGAVMLGADIIRQEASETARVRAGLMASALHGKSKTRASASQISSKGRAEGYAFGVYATIGSGYEQPEASGLYVDLWMQYAHMRNTVNPSLLPSEKYRADGLIASAEAGWKIPLGYSGSEANDNHVRWSIVPQAQFIYEGISSDGLTENNGTTVKFLGQDNVKMRLGARLEAAKVVTSAGKPIQSFLELNWIHNTRRQGVQMNATHVMVDGVRNTSEVRFGVETNLSKQVHLWVNGACRIGKAGLHEEVANVGVRYTF